MASRFELLNSKEGRTPVKGGFVGYDEAKDFDWLFAPNADWVATVAGRAERDGDDQAIERRETDYPDDVGVLLRGTFHKPPGDA